MSHIINTITEMKSVTEVNEHKTVEMLKEGVIPNVTTGTEKRTRYYTTKLFVEKTADLIRAFFGIDESVPQKTIFARKDLKEIHKNRTNRCTVLTTFNLKGGVGKTTNTVNVGIALAKLKQKVLIIDTDPQSQASSYFRKESFRGNSINQLFEMYMRDDVVTKEDIREKIFTEDVSIDDRYSVDMLPSELRLAKTIEIARSRKENVKILSKIINEVRDDYDYIVLDSPPNAGFIFEINMYATDEILFSTNATEKSLEGLELTIEEILELNQTMEKKVNVAGIMVNNYNRNYNHHKEAMDLIVENGERIGVTQDKIYVTRYAPTVVEASQEYMLSIIDYKKKVKQSIEIFEPTMKLALDKLIERNKIN